MVVVYTRRLHNLRTVVCELWSVRHSHFYGTIVHTFNSKNILWTTWTHDMHHELVVRTTNSQYMYSSLWVVISDAFSFLWYTCTYVQLKSILWMTWTNNTHHSLTILCYKWDCIKIWIVNWVSSATVAFTEPHLTSIIQDNVNPTYPGHVSNVSWNMYYFLIKNRSYLF